jgi:hypothetical protein
MASCTRPSWSPTGAALVKVWPRPAGPLPAMTMTAVGCGRQPYPCR